MWIIAANFRRIGLACGLAATRRSVYIHQMNRVNSRNDFFCTLGSIDPEGYYYYYYYYYYLTPVLSS